MIWPYKEHGQKNNTEKGIRSVQETYIWNNPEQDGLARYWMTKERELARNQKEKTVGRKNRRDFSSTDP